MISIALSIAAVLLVGCNKSGKVQDEAKQAGRTPGSFPAADEDYFTAMDNGVGLTLDEVKGRNMWIVWSGGNDRFWDVMTNASFGAFDLLKTVSSAPGLKFSRDNRWEYLGLVNEPCFTKATGPDTAALRVVARPAQPELSARPVRQCRQISGRRGRRARQEHPRGLLLRRANRHRRIAPVPQPGL